MKHLVRYMAREKLNQATLAKSLGIAPCTLSLILSGDRKPGIEVTKKIERVTGIPRDKLRPDIFGVS